MLFYAFRKVCSSWIKLSGWVYFLKFKSNLAPTCSMTFRADESAGHGLITFTLWRRTKGCVIPARWDGALSFWNKTFPFFYCKKRAQIWQLNIIFVSLSGDITTYRHQLRTASSAFCAPHHHTTVVTCSDITDTLSMEAFNLFSVNLLPHIVMFNDKSWFIWIKWLYSCL